MQKKRVDLHDKLEAASRRLGSVVFGVASVEDADKLKPVVMDEYKPIKSVKVRSIMADAQSIIFFGIQAVDDADELAIRRSRNRWDYPGYFPLKLIGRGIVDILKKEGYKAIVPPETIPRKAIASLTSIAAYGKNSMMLSEKYGLSLRIEIVITDAKIRKDRPLKKDICKDCDRCIKACPTQAIIKPYVLDPCRCFVRISEMGTEDEELRRKFDRRGSWMTPNSYVMCTICQMACPYTSQERRNNKMRRI